MLQLTIVTRPQLLAAATAITAVGFLTVSPPAQAHPTLPLPLAPACSQWGFPGKFSLKQSNGDTVRFNATGPSPRGVLAEATTPSGRLQGSATGDITGDKFFIDIGWDVVPISAGQYSGVVGNDGFVHGETYDAYSTDTRALWDSTVPLVCTTPAASAPAPAAAPAPAQQPTPPAAQTASARLGVAINGPTTLPAGTSGTYTVSVSNPGDVSAPVELFISFNGNLQQTGQPAPSGGFDCAVSNYAGGTSSVHCTVGQFGSKATANITVQGQGSAPGAAQLVVNINSSDPAAQFVQKSQQLNVTIT
jgi:hypothetical protein